MKTSSPGIVLASASPRRRELLRQAGFGFEVVPAAGEEPRPLPGEDPSAYVGRAALLKASAVFALRPDAVVVGADTAVALGGRILGKPSGFAEFAAFMRLLGGRTHTVHTGWAVLCARGTACGATVSEVDFAEPDDDDIRSYWATGEPADKAGGYAIQGAGGAFVKAVRGSVSSIVGLPQAEIRSVLKDMLRRYGNE